VIGAMAVVIVMTAITLLDVPLIARLSDWFFTTHAAAWRMLFDEPLPVGEILRSAVILLVHCIVFFIVTALVIERRDILT